MSRKYQHTKELLPQIKKMLDQGMTHKQIEEQLALTGNRPVHELLKRERKKEATVRLPKSRTRKTAKTLQEYRSENKRLQMENELLRDFLSLTERK